MSRNIIEKLVSAIKLSAGGGIAYIGLSIYNNNETFYKNIYAPAMLKCDPHLAHDMAIKIFKYNLIPKSRYVDDPVLRTKLVDLELSNPIGMAAGFDKQAEAISGLNKLGFGLIEVGTVTPKPQPGNPTPRVFRLPEDRAIINRFSFNSDGHAKVLQNFEIHKNVNNTKLGVNLGKNKDSDNAIADYTEGIEIFGPKVDYLVINISSPNTPGLRDLQSKDNLYRLLSKIVVKKNSLNCEKKPLIFLKLSPDLSNAEKKDIAKILNKKECKVDGLIISNTTTRRPSLRSDNQTETGGLSGRPLKNISTELIGDMYDLTEGKIPIVGVGGVENGRDAYEKILAGATAVQIYTCLVYDGPPVVARIKRELTELLKSEGFENVNEAVGARSKTKR